VLAFQPNHVLGLNFVSMERELSGLCTVARLTWSSRSS
jgi:hypothetical protein